MPDSSRAYSRDVALSALVEDPLFANLFLPDPDIIKGIVISMKANGFDIHRPIDVWKDAKGRGQHIILEGHQRFTAAKKAGLPTVRVAYREFSSRLEALLWAADQQAGRRNVNREVQCLSVLRALDTEGSLATSTTKELSARLKFATATIDRSRQLLKHGTQAEILAVLEGAHGLKQAYDLLRQRRGKSARADSAPTSALGKKRPPVLTALRNDLAKAIDGGLIELAEALRHARWLLNWLDGQAPDVPTDDEEADDAAVYRDVVTPAGAAMLNELFGVAAVTQTKKGKPRR
jgi:ParB-like chromosome segregation protein Spo0J